VIRYSAVAIGSGTGRESLSSVNDHPGSIGSFKIDYQALQGSPKTKIFHRTPVQTVAEVA
jgi:hypothetical protein